MATLGKHLLDWAKSISYQLNGTFTGSPATYLSPCRSRRPRFCPARSGSATARRTSNPCPDWAGVRMGATGLPKTGTCSGDVQSTSTAADQFLWDQEGLAWFNISVICSRENMNVSTKLLEFITPHWCSPPKKTSKDLANHQSDGNKLGAIGKKLKPITLNNHLPIMPIMPIIPSSTVCQIKLRDLYSSELTL